MTLSFPLPLDAFWDILPMASLVMDCAPQLESAGTASGQYLTREIGPALWRGTVTLGKLMPGEASEVAALVDLVRQPGASFLACDLTRRCPSMDPDGDILGTANVVAQSISANHRELTLAGLPPNYQIRRGDLIGISWGANPVRYGLHRIVVPANADGSGVTGMIEVTPALPWAFTAVAPVTLVRPSIKAVIVPGSMRAGTLRRAIYDGASFDFIQTLR